MTKIINASSLNFLGNNDLFFEDIDLIGEFKVTDKFKHSIIFKNCNIENISIISCELFGVVKFINCKIVKCNFSWTYFYLGLLIENCNFDNSVDFQISGHNNETIIISNNIFNGFVNFFDCTFYEKFQMTHNVFHKGTNILGFYGEMYAPHLKKGV
jgi:hypothetical protein